MGSSSVMILFWISPGRPTRVQELVSVYIAKWYGEYSDIGRSCWSLVDNRVLGEWGLVVSSQWDEPQAGAYCGQGSALIGASEVEPDARKGD
jgi:hypothetical protein